VVGSFARFKVNTAIGPLGPFELHVPGRHNVLNATAAVAIANSSEWMRRRSPWDSATSAAWTGASSTREQGARRHRRGRLWPPPHGDSRHYGRRPRVRLPAHSRRLPAPRFSRTLDLLDEFTRRIRRSDTVIVLPIYAASENPSPA